MKCVQTSEKRDIAHTIGTRYAGVFFHLKRGISHTLPVRDKLACFFTWQAGDKSFRVVCNHEHPDAQRKLSFAVVRPPGRHLLVVDRLRFDASTDVHAIALR